MAALRAGVWREGCEAQEAHEAFSMRSPRGGIGEDRVRTSTVEELGDGLDVSCSACLSNSLFCWE